MYNYSICSLSSPKISNRLLRMNAKFRSKDDRLINGQVHIGFTKQNDIILRVYPWGKSSEGSNFSPISYEIQNITNNSFIKDGDRIRLENDNTQIGIHDDRIELIRDDDQIVEIVLDRTTDLKNNLCTRGTGFRTRKFNNNPERIDKTSVNIRMASDERVYGGGERFKRINHTGSDVEVQVTQGAGTKNDKTYKSVPRFISNRGYGYSINTYNKVTCHFGTQSSEITEITSNSSSIEVLFTLGDDEKDCLSKLYAYESVNKNPPLWSYGFWSSRNTYESWDEVIDIAREYREREVPCDVIHLDPAWIGSFKDYSFDWSDSFDDAEQYIDELHSMGFKISIWLYPYVPVSSGMYENTNKSYFVDDARGGKFIFNDYQKLALVDFTNPDAFEWWSSELSNIILDGVDIIKADFAEYVDENTVYHNGRTGYEMRNAYPDIYQEACVSAFEKAGREPILWSRSGWLSQNKNSIHWNGDAESDWEGYRSTIRSGLNAAMSSYSFWSSDVGGYRNNPSDELYGEWMKFSAFGSPHIRAHGKSPREPWEYPSSYVESKEVLQERYRLVPYIYSYGQVAENTGLPIMRPEFLSVNDPSYYKENSQYFMGDHLLIAPYLSPDRSRDVYLPADSDWISYWGEDEYTGGQEIHTDYSDYIIPVFVRKGSAIPVFNENMNSIKSDNNVNIKKYGRAESKIKTPYYDGYDLFDIVANPDGSISVGDRDVTTYFEDIIS